ncbi:MAG: HYR domain-containing protein [Saprospiraceae bacterium]|nr:HYR domain-containing protein [Saprospiraceae bacterium]
MRDANLLACRSVEVQVIPQNCFADLDVCFEDEGNFTNEVVLDRTTGIPAMGAWDEAERYYEFNATLAATNNDEPVEYWTISPFFDFGNASNIILQFRTLESDDATDLEVLWSSDYFGTGNPNEANWNLLQTYTEPGTAVSIQNRIIDLSSLGAANLAGFYVAFRYKDDAMYSAWQVSDVTIRADNCEPSRCMVRNIMQSTTCITDDSISVRVMFDIAGGSGEYEILNAATNEVLALLEDVATSGSFELSFGLNTELFTDSINLILIDGTKRACREDFTVLFPDCIVCFRDNCDFFISVPVLQNTDRDNWTCTEAGGYAVNGFCVGNCGGNSELWLVSRALEFDNATEAFISFDIIENFNGPALEFLYSTNYNGGNTATDIRNATWIPLNNFSRTILDVKTDLSPIDGIFYLGFKYTSRPGANASSGFNVQNIVLDADVCEPASSECRLTDLIYSAMPCENQGTNTVSDDVFLATIAVKFITPPGTGTLDLSGSFTASVPVSELDSDTLHIFELQLPSNGAVLDIEANFSDDPLCYLVRKAVATAEAPCSALPDCSFPYFSEYVEISSGFNRAVEIYNPTGDTIDLAAENYVVAVYLDGSTTSNSPVLLTGIIEPGCTYVVVSASATNPILKERKNQENGSINFGGDDAVALLRGGINGEILDVIGIIGNDPGTEWRGFFEGNILSTKETVLRRLPSIRKGDNIPFDLFFGQDPQWRALPISDLTGIGAHESECITCDLMVVSTETSPEFCAESEDGSITVTATATLPILYSIDGGINFQSGNTFDGLAAGDYTIVLKTSKLVNCADTVMATVAEGPNVTITEVEVRNEVCPNDADGSIAVFANFPNAALEYSIDGGVTFQASNEFDELADGSYNIVVRVAGGRVCGFASTIADVAPGIDLEAPRFVCPNNQVVSTDVGECVAVVNDLALTDVTDNCDDAPVVTYILSGATEQAATVGFASGVSFALGVTTVTYTVTDKNGQFATCEFTVTVQDREAPVFANCPSDIIIPNATEFYRNGGIVTWTVPTVADNCTATANLKLENNQAPGFEPELGVTNIRYTATDEAGNVGVCSFNIIVQDAYITDPCNCLNNRSNPVARDGQFAETVTVFSAPAEIWRIVGVTGLFEAPVGVFPPASGVRYALRPFRVGDVIREVPVGSGNYVLNGLHVEGVGYQIVVSNGTTTLRVGNSCSYEVACDGDITIPLNSIQPVAYTLDCSRITKFLDDGGDGAPYFDDGAQNNIVIICPDQPSTRVTRVVFNKFDVAPGEQLLAYDGNNLAAARILSSTGGTGTGSSVADAPGGGWVEASCENVSGCITFEFIRNGDRIKGAGWSASIECAPREGEFSCPIQREFLYIANECNLIDEVQIPLPTIGSCGTAILPDISFACEAPVFTTDLANGVLTIRDLPVGVHVLTYTDPVFASRTCPITIKVLPATLTCNDETNVSLSNECVIALTPDMLLENPCIHPNVRYEMYFSDPHVQVIGETIDGFPIADFSSVPCGTRLDVKLERYISAACGDDYLDVCWGRIVVEDKEAPEITGDLVDDYAVACFYDGDDLLARLNAIPRDGRGAILNLRPLRVNVLTTAYDTSLVIESAEAAFDVVENCSAGFVVSEWQAVEYDCSTNAFTGIIANAADPLWALMNVEVEVPNGAGSPAIFKCYFRVVKAIDDCGNESNIAIQRICVLQPDIVSPQPEISLPCGADTDPIALYELWASDPDRYRDYATYLPNFDPTPLDVNGGFSLFANLEDSYFTNASGDEVPAYPEHNDCGYAIDWTDSEPIAVCADNYKIFREWIVYNWCDGHLELIDVLPQVIKVGDTDAPVLVGEPTFFGTGNSRLYDCASDALIQIEVQSGCAELKSAYIDFADNNLPDAEFEIVNNQIIAQNVPIEQVFTYSLRLIDECGNSGSYGPFKGLLADNIPPAAICERFHTVSLGEDCTVLVPAETFDDGSYDNCGTVTFSVARMDSDVDGDGIALEKEDFGRFVQFTSTDLVDGCTGSVQVVLKVTDGSGNSNLCMVAVELQDKQRPVCEARPSLVISCFDTLVPQITSLLLLSESDRIAAWQTILESGAVGGLLVVRDNCSETSVEVTELDLSGFNLSCNAGIIKYAFFVTDACGYQSEVCHEVLTVDGDYHDWSMVFPRDRILTCTDRFLQFRIPRPETLDRILEVNRGCDEWALEVEIDDSRASADACYQLIYNYHLINWCTWDPRNVEPAVVERPNQEFPDSLLTESFQRVRIAYRDQFVNMNFPQNAITTILSTVNDECETIALLKEDSIQFALNGLNIGDLFGRDGINDLDDYCDNDEYDVPPRPFNNFGFDADWVRLESFDEPYAGNVTFYDVGSILTTDTVRYVSAQQYGNIVYRQVIRIYDATPPTIKVEPFDAFCAGDTELTSDACSAPVELFFEVGDACAEDFELEVTYQLKPFLDDAVRIHLAL